MDYSDELLKSVQDKSLEMMIEISKFFDDNKIGYFLSFGTLLGAVRHGGFIPWDDDVDFDMHIDDMRKLAKICKKDKQFNKKYFLQNKWTDSNVPCEFWRIRMNGTTMMDEEGLHIKMHWGLPIDIFPVYNAPKNFFLRKIMCVCKRRMFIHSNFSFLNFKASFFRKKVHLIIYNVYFFSLLFFSKCFNNSKYLFYSRRQFVDKSVFFPLRTIDFEGHSFKCHNLPEEYLRIQYGDFMQLPPEEERVGHGCYKVDMEKDYTEYVEYR